MLTLQVITQPTEEPITLPEAKAHLRVDFADDDGYITALISAARDYAEGFQKRCLAVTTLELSLDRFSSIDTRFSADPLDRLYSDFMYSSRANPIKLLRGPVSSVTSVKYTRSDNSVVTVNPSDYIVKSNGDIIPAYGKYWPINTLIPADGVRIQYVAGYTPLTIPPSTKMAMLLLIGHWYENREAVVVMSGKTPQELPMAVCSLLWLDRTW